MHDTPTGRFRAYLEAQGLEDETAIEHMVSELRRALRQAAAVAARDASKIERTQ